MEKYSGLVIAISDIDNVLDSALKELDKRIDQIYPSGRFRLKFDTEKGPGRIDVELSNTKFTDIGSHVKKGVGEQSWVIKIDTELNDKDDIYRDLAHEVTHVSQEYNGFRNYEFSQEAKVFKEQLDKGRLKTRKERDKFREHRHPEKFTEKEAKLVGLMTFLKRGFIEKAVKEVFDIPDYLNYVDWQKFVKIAWKYGVSKQQIEDLRKKIQEKFDQVFSHVGYTPTSEAQGWFEYTEWFFKYKIISEMFNIDVKKYVDWIKENAEMALSSKKEDQTSWNLKYFRDQVGKL